MERVLISGGNGFLGSHLAEKCVSEGMDVTIVDDFSTSKGINVPPGVRIIRKRIENTHLSGRYHYIIHFAARPSPEDYVSNPVETLLSNSTGTLNMLETARESNAVFLYTSSSEIYGNATVIPTPETYYGFVNSTGPRSCYDEGKRFSESLIMAYYRKYGIDARMQRPFNVYGPRIRPDGQYGRVVPRFILQALKNDKITIHGDGLQTRSFLHVSDWLKATWLMLTADGIAGETFNVGSDKEITILNLANMIVDLIKSGSEIAHLDSRTDDPRRRAADITKIKNALRWRPTVSLSEGLRNVTEWIRNTIS